MPKRDDPADLTAAARFIEDHGGGSKAGAIRLIKAAKVCGSRGRPTEYLEHDAAVLHEVEALQNEYRSRGVKAPKRRTLIKQVVSRKLADGEALGNTANAAAQRIGCNPSLIEMLSKAKPRSADGPGESGEFWTELARHLPPDTLEQVRKMDPSKLSNFGMALELIACLFAFARRNPRRFKRVQQQVAEPALFLKIK